MKIARWDEGGGGTMVRVTPAEALRLIESLSRQIRTEDPNSGRMEFHQVEGGHGVYFSISVDKDDTLTRLRRECDDLAAKYQKLLELRDEFRAEDDGASHEN